MNPIRYMLSQALLPIWRAMIKRRWRAEHYSSFQEGGCHFWGPPDFVELCSRSMNTLSKMDKALHESLTGRDLSFWLEPNGPLIFDEHFGISENFVAWREQGVIAFIAYAHFRLTLTSGTRTAGLSAEEKLEMRSGINAALREWLQSHSFPQELVGTFD